MSSEEQNLITYSTQICDTKHVDWRKKISHKDVDDYDFTKVFIEVLDKPEFVRPYFDFDGIETESEYKDVIRWLNKIQSLFGPYAIGGYTKSEEFVDYGFKLIPEGHHTLSFHVVFYTSKIKSDLLIKLMKTETIKSNDENRKKITRFIYETVNKSCDPNVYKLNTRQLMRHPLSDKFFKKGFANNVKTAGSIINYLNPQHLLATPKGTEFEIKEEDFNEMFIPVVKQLSEDDEPVKETVTELKTESSENITPVKRSHHKKQTTIDDITYEDDLILYNKEQLTEFIDKLNINVCFDGLISDLAPLWYSPYSKEFLIHVLSEWYNQVEHVHKNTVESVINNYYHKEYTNKWFYTLLKKFATEDVRETYIKQHKDHVDLSININDSDLTWETVKERSYKVDNITKLLNDLRAVFGNVDEKWYLKTMKNNQNFIITLSDETLRQKTKTNKPFRNNAKINLYQILMKYSSVFRYKEARLEKTTEENVINLFQGYKYKEIMTDDFTIIQPFLDHIKNIICFGNEEKYNYFLSWWADIIQNTTVKTCTMPIIHGSQGSGKSFVVETLCEILGNYALCNVDDLDKVFGKFNGLLGYHLVVCINEPPEASEKFTFTGKIKSKLTQKKIVMETKGIDQIEVESWSNYIMTTNSFCPVKEEKGDRRLIYYETDNSKMGDEEYFNNLCKIAQPKKQGDYNPVFMGTLLHYLNTQIDVSDFNAERLIRQINAKTNVEFNEQLERQYESLSLVDRYVVDHYKDFEKGIGTDYIKDYMNLSGHTENSVVRALQDSCNKKRIQKDKKRLVYYFLKPRIQNQALYNIIDYKEYNGETEELTEEYFNTNKF